MKTQKFIFGYKIVRFSAAFQKYPLSAAPENLVVEGSPSTEETSQSLVLFVSKFKGDVYLSEFEQFLSLKKLMPLSPAQAVNSASNIVENKNSRPYIIPVFESRQVKFLGLYFYPNYRFLDWILRDVDIRISHYSCVGLAAQ